MSLVRPDLRHMAEILPSFAILANQDTDLCELGHSGSTLGQDRLGRYWPASDAWREISSATQSYSLSFPVSDPTYQRKTKERHERDIHASVEEDAKIKRKQCFNDEPSKYAVEQRSHEVGIAFSKCVTSGEEKRHAETHECRAVYAVPPRHENTSRHG